MEREWSSIELIISDFDGVMTDNRVLVDEAGKESVFVSRADGQAVHLLRSMGIDVVIISSETNGVVGRRADKLKVKCIQSVSDKKECVKKYSEENGILFKKIAYVGNDINDYAAMQLCGIKIVPNDAYEEVKHIADYITQAKGGYGVIREIADGVKRNRRHNCE